MEERAAVPRELATDILKLLNQAGEKIDAIREITRLLKEGTGLEAVGVRLKEGDDYPYYVTYGFPAVFVKAENYLCARDSSGQVVRDSGGNPVLECMCGNIIRGRTDPSLPFFTPGGSFWTNSTTELLASTTEKDRQSLTRNRCNSEGYESVALIPLRSDIGIIGLLQINDSRQGKFTLEMINFFEGIGESIGIAIARKQAEEAGKLKQLNQAIADSQKEERKRIARELHDEVGQILTAIQMGLEIILLDHAGLGETVGKELRSVIELVKRAGKDIHRISSRLNPETLDDSGLTPSIDHEDEAQSP